MKQLHSVRQPGLANPISYTGGRMEPEQTGSRITHAAQMACVYLCLFLRTSTEVSLKQILSLMTVLVLVSVGVFAQSKEDSVKTALTIKSTPPGADIYIDENFIGNTPSIINVSAGQHSISIRRNGYQEWVREMKFSGGQVTLNAELSVTDAASVAGPNFTTIKRPEHELVRPEPALVTEANAHLKTRYEAAQQVTWYEPKDVHSYSEHGHKMEVYPYLGKGDNGKVWMRLKGSATGKEWIFVSRLRVVIDGEAKILELNRTREIDKKVINTALHGVEVRETVDIENRDDLIQQVAHGRDVYFSFEGNTRRSEFHMTQVDIQNFVWIVTTYDGLR